MAQDKDYQADALQGRTCRSASPIEGAQIADMIARAGGGDHA